MDDERRKFRSRYLRTLRKHTWEMSNEFGVPFKKLLKVAAAEDQRLMYVVVLLLRTKSFKSDFRQDLATQVRAWFSAADPKHVTPLSIRQVLCVYPKVPEWRYKLEQDLPKTKALQVYCRSFETESTVV